MQNKRAIDTEDEEFPNAFEKWLRTRLNYAVMSVTGEPSTPGFIEAVVSGGSCKYLAASGIRDELWVKNRYPQSTFFSNKVVKFKYPPPVAEILDLRFSRDPLNKPKEELRSGPNNPVYEVTLHELATIPSWGAPSVAPEHMKLSGQTQKIAAKTTEDRGTKKRSHSSSVPKSLTPFECQHLVPKPVGHRRIIPVQRQR